MRLILLGPPGAGKTEAARVIAQSHFLRAQDHYMHWEHNAASLGKDFEVKIIAEVNYQMFGNSDKEVNPCEDRTLLNTQKSIKVSTF